MDMNPPLHLIHRAPAENAELILQEGFDPTFPPGMHGTVLARCKLRGLEPNEEEWIRCLYDEDTSDEAQARRIFNAVLDRARNNIDPSLPGHDREAVFFWPSVAAADEIYQENIERAEKEGYKLGHSCQIVVDASKVPCECYEGDSGIVGSLYWLIYNNLDLAEACVSGKVPPIWDAPTFFSAMNLCAVLDELASAYYKLMEPIDEKTPYKPHQEVLCPCAIPTDAIIDTDCAKQHELPFEEAS